MDVVDDFGIDLCSICGVYSLGEWL